MPIATAQSETGEYTFSIFVVITLTLLASSVRCSPRGYDGRGSYGGDLGSF